MAFTPVAVASKSSTPKVLCTSLKHFHEVAKLLREHEHDLELKTSYIFLEAYFLLCAEVAKRITQTTDGDKNDPTTQLMEMLQSFVVSTDPSYGATSTSRLSFLNQAWVALPNTPSSKLAFIGEHIRFGISPEERTAFIRVMDSWERYVKSHFPDDVRDEAMEDASKLGKLSRPSYEVSKATQSVFVALLGCKACSCSPTHDFGATLGLGTYRQSNKQGHEQDDDESFNFDIFLSRAEDLHETRVRAIAKAAKATKSAKQQVRWSDTPTQGTAARTKKAKVPRQQIRQLCEPINKMRARGAQRLELEVEETALYKLRSGREMSIIDIAKRPTSLDFFLRHRKDSFNERTKRILAILLGYAVLHLIETPWLPDDWKSENVFFFHTTSSRIPLRPFLGSRLWLKTQAPSQDRSTHGSFDPDDDVDPDDIDPDDLDPDDQDPDDIPPHAFPTIVSLAIMLMEVFTATPFDELANVHDVEVTGETFFDAKKLMKQCAGDIPWRWREVVYSCLDPQTWESEDDEMPLDNLSLRSRVYEDIIQPLELDLLEAFPDISLEGLDELAQSLDLNKWGQHRQPAKPLAPLPLKPALDYVEETPEPLDNPSHTPKRASTTYSLASQCQPCPSISSFRPPVRRFTEPKGDEGGAASAYSEPSVGGRTLVESSSSRTYDDYTVGVVCAMSFEMSAVRYMLDHEHPDLPTKVGDSNKYTLGDLHGHNVVLACLPGQQGKGVAAGVAANMRRTFSSIKWYFLVGIGGGVPSDKNDIRLGDVVVSMPEGPHVGVVQYDLGRATDTHFQQKGFLYPPPPLLRSAVERMRSDHLSRDNRIVEYLSAMIGAKPRLAMYDCPSDTDVLFREDYSHAVPNSSCAGCDMTKTVNRPLRVPDRPVIHYGLIASGDSVLKSTLKRSEAIRGLGDVLCFEMEAGGAMSEAPCIVIRGISDYADSHKNDNWHKYAAATAAACAKELLSFVDA